ncbi:hypothetical protein [Schlesneria paludicola]|uniref:hypothetical protein n=1 Tax=Schlesneria paludicola TaxID=360056 RepID=UPI000299DBD6|nr:hypothetical protein [Schlesneria paludicola]
MNSIWLLIPGTILLTLPKCPVCLAVYFTFWTGIGLSLSTASAWHTGLAITSITLLLLIVARNLANWRVHFHRRWN